MDGKHIVKIVNNYMMRTKMNKIYLNHPGNSTVVMILAPTGAINEYNDLKGISHYLEHVCFKGTVKRTAKQLASEIENIGGILNAFTDFELTCYWAKVPNKHKQIAINVIEDLVCNPLLDEKEIEKERDVILQELKMGEDNPRENVWDLFYKTIFDRKCGLYLPIVGTRKSLPNINKAEILDYYKLHYDPLTMIIVGDVENEEAIEIPIERKNEIILKKNPKIFRLRKKGGIKQSNIVIGNIKRLPDFSGNTSKFILSILSGIFNDMSGRLFRKLREEQNLCYSIHFSSYVWENNHILWTVNMGLDKKNIEVAKEMIIAELNKEILNDELDNSFIKRCGNHQLSLDNIVRVAEKIAYTFNRSFNWKDYVIDYEKNLNKAIVHVRDFVKELDFNDNKLVGIIPYEK